MSRQTVYVRQLTDLLQQRHIQPDADQQQALETIGALLDAPQHTRLFHKAPPGVYLWGPPGLGKSLLMDSACHLYQGRKLRIHFHEFLQQINRLLTTRQPNTRDPLVETVDCWLHGIELLCFDEFHVHDIADAMLLGRFLHRSAQHGLKIILTSNYPPQGLLPNPRYHERMKPTIDLIEQRFHILPFTGSRDYRETDREPDGRFLSPLTPDTDTQLLEKARKLDPQLATGEIPINLSGRLFTARFASEQLLGFDFAQLCAKPSAYTDYLQLTQRCQVLFLSGITARSLQDDGAAQRFLWLIDILYDRRLPLYVSAEGPLIELLQQHAAIADIPRACSRLKEMA